MPSENSVFGNLTRLNLRLDMDRAQLSTLLCELACRVDDGEQFVYWQATRGSALRDHAYGEMSANLTVMLRPKKVRNIHQPMRLITAEDKRYLYCNMKTINLLPSVMTAQLAMEAGADECVLHRGDRVTECSHSNVSMLSGGCFVTPPADEYILPGVGRAHLMAACRTLGIPVEERVFTMQELMDADEVIVSSAGILGNAAYEIDSVPVGGKDAQTLARLQRFVHEDWLKKTEK
jgi:D-alanine transaminase